ncbi:MAG: hypothetical protein J5I93_18435 [Pirellulaceae bacterium]|nr:hypothetical protein [Pirellulaceae bacterium]
MAPSQSQPGTGVQELIDRLSREGVAEGERRADELLEAARREAHALLAAARRQADELLAEAQREADQYRQAAEQALQLAARDMVRELEARISNNFRNRLRRLVAHELQDPDVLKQLLREVAARAAPEQDQPLELLLSPDIITDAQVRQQLDSGQEDALTRYVRGLIGDSIREGLQVGIGGDEQSGIRLRVVDQDIEVDLTPETISHVIGQHLLPRFRSIMRHS